MGLMTAYYDKVSAKGYMLECELKVKRYTYYFYVERYMYRYKNKLKWSINVKLIYISRSSE